MSSMKLAHTGSKNTTNVVMQVINQYKYYFNFNSEHMLFKIVKTKNPETIAPFFFGDGREMFLNT